MEFIMRTNTVTGVILGLLMVFAEPSQAQNIPNAESCPTWDCEIENQLCLKADGANYSGDYICTNKKWVKLDNETTGGDGGVTASGNENNQEELNRLRNELEQVRSDKEEFDSDAEESTPNVQTNESTGHEEIGVRSELEDKRRLNDETYRLRAESFEAECNEQVKTGLWKTNNHKALCDEAILDNKITIEKGHWPDKYLNDLQQQLQQEAEPNIRLNVVEKRVHIKSEAEKLEELYESKCFTSLNSKFGNCKEQYCAKVAHPTCTDDQNARRLSGKLESGACRCGQHRVGNASGVGYSMPCIPSPECGF